MNVYILRRCGTGRRLKHFRPNCRGRGNQRFPRLVPCDVARVHDPPRLRVHDLYAVAPVVVAEIQGVTRPCLAVQFALPRGAMVCRLAERQGQHRRMAPVKDLVRGKHAAVRRIRGAVEPLRSPQDGLHPQTGAVRVPNSLQLFQVHVREEPIHLNAGRVGRLDGS